MNGLDCFRLNSYQFAPTTPPIRILLSQPKYRNYLRIYTNGLISNLPRKNGEAIALQANAPVRSVQWFLAKQNWDHQKMKNKLQKIIAKEHVAHNHSDSLLQEM